MIECYIRLVCEQCSAISPPFWTRKKKKWVGPTDDGWPAGWDQVQVYGALGDLCPDCLERRRRLDYD